MRIPTLRGLKKAFYLSAASRKPDAEVVHHFYTLVHQQPVGA